VSGLGDRAARYIYMGRVSRPIPLGIAETERDDADRPGARFLQAQPAMPSSAPKCRPPMPPVIGCSRSRRLSTSRTLRTVPKPNSRPYPVRPADSYPRLAKSPTAIDGIRPRKSGSHRTPRRREPDSNPRSRVRKGAMPSSSDHTRVGRTLTLGGGAESSLEGRDIELSVSPSSSGRDRCPKRRCSSSMTSR
jgi:hypothetical protein